MNAAQWQAARQWLVGYAGWTHTDAFTVPREAVALWIGKLYEGGLDQFKADHANVTSEA